MSTPIRVVLAEDHTIVREGLRSLLSPREDIEIVGEAGDGREAVETAVRLQPDVIVLDLNMPGLGGVEAIRSVRERAPDVHVLVLSMHGSPEYVRPAIRAGAEGYLLKGSGLSDLVAGVRAVSSGNAFFSPEVARIVVEGSRDGSTPPLGADLTPREREVLKLVAEGYSSPEIAKLLGLSVKTIEGHRGRIMAKLEAQNVAGLVRHAIRMGLVPTEA